MITRPHFPPLRVSSAIRAFGLQDEISDRDLADPDLVIRIGAPPNMEDLIKQVDGIEFQDAYAESHVVTADNLTIRVIGRKHLVINKQASGKVPGLG